MENNIGCNEVEELLIDFVSGKLSQETMLAIRNHVIHCKECEKFLVGGIEILSDTDKYVIDEENDTSEISPNKPTAFFNKLSARAMMKKNKHTFNHIREILHNFDEEMKSSFINIRWQLLPVCQLSNVPIRIKNVQDNEQKINCAQFKKNIDDIKIEIFAEHLESEVFNLDIFIKNRPLPETISIVLFDYNDKQTSRPLVSEDPITFECLKYGIYNVIVMQHGLEKGMVSLGINREGINEK